MEFVTLFSTGALVISLATMLVVRLLRAGAELIKADVTQQPIFKKLILPFAAIAVGGCLGMLTSVVPLGLAGTVADRLLFGGLCGGMSTIVWRAFSSFIHGKFNISIDDEQSDK